MTWEYKKWVLCKVDRQVCQACHVRYQLRRIHACQQLILIDIIHLHYVSFENSLTLMNFRLISDDGWMKTWLTCYRWINFRFFAVNKLEIFTAFVDLKSVFEVTLQMLTDKSPRWKVYRFGNFCSKTVSQRQCFWEKNFEVKLKYLVLF